MLKERPDYHGAGNTDLALAPHFLVGYERNAFLERADRRSRQKHERLQFLVASVDTRERWRELRTDILDEIGQLAGGATPSTVVDSNPRFARDARIDLVKPLIRLLTLDKDLGGVMDVLTAFYGDPGAKRRGPRA